MDYGRLGLNPTYSKKNRFYFVTEIKNLGMLSLSCDTKLAKKIICALNKKCRI